MSQKPHRRRTARPAPAPARPRRWLLWGAVGLVAVATVVVVALTTLRPAPAVTAAPSIRSSDGVQRIAPAEAHALLSKGAALLYDVRPLEAYQAKHASGAIWLPEEELPSMLATLPQDKALILYCT